MKCQSCDTALPEGANVCPQCGSSVGAVNDNEPTDSATTDEPTDGSHSPRDRQGAPEQPGQPTATAGGGHGGGSGGPGGGTGGPGGGPGGPSGGTGGPGQGHSGSPGNPGHPGQSGGGDAVGSLKRELEALPLKVGAALGALALVIPYALVAVPTLVVVDDNPLDVVTSVFFVIVEFGQGSLIVDLLTTASSELARPMELTPANHPEFQQELASLQQILLDNPDVPFLLLYLVFPWIVFLSGRLLARYYAETDSYVEHAKTGASVAAGTVAVVFVLGVAFDVPDLAGKTVATGLLLPAVLGAVGGVTVAIWDDYSAFGASFYGWLAALVGFAAAFVLQETPSAGDAGQVSEEVGLDTLGEAVLAMRGWLGALQFETGGGGNASLILLAVLLAIVAAGFVLTWRGRAEIADAGEGALAGSSVFLGFLGPVAVLGWFAQIGIVFVSLGSGTSLGGSASVATFDDYYNLLLVGGVVIPALLGALGGYLAIWYRDRNRAGARSRGQPQNPS